MRSKHQNTSLLTCDFKRLDFFSTMDEKAQNLLITNCVGMKVKAGDEIIGYLEEDDGVFFVLEGIVRVNMLAASGRQITYQILNSGDMFGEMAAIDRMPRSASVLGETDVILAKLPAASFLKLATENAEFALMIMGRLTRLSRWLAARVFEYHAYNVRGRVYLELLRLSADHPDESSAIKISDRDMASRVGTTRENVTRICGALKQEKVIRRDLDGMKILDKAKLNELLAKCEFS